MRGSGWGVGQERRRAGSCGATERGVVQVQVRLSEEMEEVKRSELLSPLHCSSGSFRALDVSGDLLCVTCLNIPSIYFFLTCFGFKVHLPALGMRRSVMADI